MRRMLALILVSCTSVVAAQTPAEQALVVMQRASEHYQNGDFARAEVLLREAIDLHETPALRYNLARTLVHLEHLDEARAQYVAYLNLAPQSENREAVESTIGELDERIEQQQQAALAAEQERDREERQRVERERAREAVERAATTPAPRSAAPAWVVFGGGLGLALAGVPFAVRSSNAVDRARSAPDQRAAAKPASDAQTNARAANGLFVAGGVLAAVGLIWGIVRKRRNAVSLSLTGVALRHEF